MQILQVSAREYGSLMAEPGEMVILYRYVEQLELDDVVGSGKLCAGSNSVGEGKFVAFTEDAAWSWGEWLEKEGYPCCVLVLSTPAEALAHASVSYQNLDGIGPAVYIEGEDLEGVLVVERRRRSK